MDPILELAAEHELAVIEDCAQAHGAQYKGPLRGLAVRRCGMVVLSRNKIMTTAGEGGMVTTTIANCGHNVVEQGSRQVVWKQCTSAIIRQVSVAARQLRYELADARDAGGRRRIQLRKMPDWHSARRENARQIWETARELSRAEGAPRARRDRSRGVQVLRVRRAGRLRGVGVGIASLRKSMPAGVPSYSGSCSEGRSGEAYDGTGWMPAERLAVAREHRRNEPDVSRGHPTLTDVEIGKTCDVLATVMGRAAK